MDFFDLERVVDLLSASYCLLYLLLLDCCPQEGNSKETATVNEANSKVVNKIGSFLNLEESLKISQSLCTHFAFSPIRFAYLCF